MYPEYEISLDQIDSLLEIEENFLNDVKAKEIKPSKLSETISAFANAAGGDVSQYDLDGKDILPMLQDNLPSPHDIIFWEGSDIETMLVRFRDAGQSFLRHGRRLGGCLRRNAGFACHSLPGGLICRCDRIADCGFRWDSGSLPRTG